MAFAIFELTLSGEICKTNIIAQAYGQDAIPRQQCHRRTSRHTHPRLRERLCMKICLAACTEVGSTHNAIFALQLNFMRRAEQLHYGTDGRR